MPVVSIKEVFDMPHLHSYLNKTGHSYPTIASDQEKNGLKTRADMANKALRMAHHRQNSVLDLIAACRQSRNIEFK